MKPDEKKSSINFKHIYLSYYPGLVRFATEYVLEQEEAENIVQDVFVMLWEQKYTLSYIENLRAYLYKIVKHKCIDFLRHAIIVSEKNNIWKDNYMLEYTYNLSAIEDMKDHLFEDSDIDSVLFQVIDELPDKCREIFLMSRFDNLSHKEIADKLAISTSTVNNQIALAMKKLKGKLQHLLSILFSFVFYFINF